MTALITRREVQVVTNGVRRHTGVVELWNEQHGFAVIRRHDTDDCVLAPLANCERPLKRGERVTFEQGMATDGRHLGKGVRLVRRGG